MPELDEAWTATRDEVARIRRAYSGYDRGSARMRWDRANPGNAAIHAERARALRTMLGERGLLPLTGPALEVGCGSGDVLASLRSLGAREADLHGVDLLPEAIAEARRRHPRMRFDCGNAERLDFPDGSFRFALAFTVFSSVLDATMARRIAAELERVLARDGALVWYDFRFDNPSNPQVRGMGLRRIGEVFPRWPMELRSVTLLPPLARRLGRATPLAYPVLARVPFLRTHYLGLLWPPGPRLSA